MVMGQTSIDKKIVNESRKSCVRIISKIGNSSGTGFFVSEDIVVTCFHVIAQIAVDNSTRNVNWSIFPDLQATNELGDTVSLTCLSIPTMTSPEPLLMDFAILKLSTKVKDKSVLKLSSKLDADVGDDIIFSGYPLGTPTMVSHFGTVSGVTPDKSIICIQAATNQGNSGGALVDGNGKVIGIVTLREGGISQALQNYFSQINQSEKLGNVQIMGIDPLQATKETIKVLDTYISTGIGYARSIKFLNDYVVKHKIKLE